MAKKMREAQFLGEHIHGDDMQHENGRGLEDAIADRLFIEQGLSAGLDGAPAEYGRDAVDHRLDRAAALKQIHMRLNSANGRDSNAVTGAGVALSNPPQEKEPSPMPALAQLPSPGEAALAPIGVRTAEPGPNLKEAAREAHRITVNLPPIGVRVDPEALKSALAREEKAGARGGLGRSARGAIAASHQRLRDIKAHLQITIDEFAHELGIHTHTLISYLYGRVKDVPTLVMDKAEALYDNDQTANRGLRAARGMALPDLVARWIDTYVPQELEGVTLTAEWDRVRVLANMLNVADTTVLRWLHGQKRTPMPDRQIAEYNDALRTAIPALPEDLRLAAGQGRGRSRPK